MKEVCIGMVGAGRATELHMHALKRVHSVPVRLKTIMARRPEQVEEAKRLYGFEQSCYSYEELLEDNEIQVIDICTPPYCHTDMIIKALRKGKHVICEKPLTGFFGQENEEHIGDRVSKQEMYQKLLCELEMLKYEIEKADTKFMYAENFVYAPAVRKAGEIIRAKKSRVLFMKGEESLKGSSSRVAGEWNKTGGGTFIRTGTHPLTAILWLKEQEAIAHQEKIRVKSVMAEMARVTPALSEYEHRHIAARPQDVEDIGVAVLSFSDNTKATIIATDTLLGGSKNYVELYCNDAAINCTLTMNSMMDTYFLDEDGMDDVYLSEMLPSKLGWNHPFLIDERVRGYIDEMQDFMEAVYYDREPVCDFGLAYETARIVYAAYMSAEIGERVTI